MFCPKCDGLKVRVTVTVENIDENETYKRYKCYECGCYFYTVEFEAITDKIFKETWEVYRKRYSNEK